MAATGLTPNIQCSAPQLAPGAQGVARVAVDDANAWLTVTFLVPFPLSPPSYLLNPLSYSLTGGATLFPRILAAALPPPASPPGPQQSVVLTLDGPGDFSVYNLTVGGPGIDPFFSSAKLRFRLACDDPFDCQTSAAQPKPPVEMPVTIDYLTKDYAGFRQALLDFSPTRLPAWTETNEADLGMMLLELFSATADNLSYMQDRVASEAFLSTATQRRSVAGHLALIGYQMDDGASACTFVQFEVNTPQSLSAGFQVSNNPSTSSDPVIVFETLSDVELQPAPNDRMLLYDWGNRNCCLPRTALSAALVSAAPGGNFNSLNIGDYLIFDAGSDRRDVVRLTAKPQVVAAQFSSPPVGSPPSSPPFGGQITLIAWGAGTPLSRDYCVANTIVRANVVPATHGETVLNDVLRELTADEILEAQRTAPPPGQRTPRQRLKLTYAPLAHLDASTIALGIPSAAPASVQNGASDFTARVPRSISTLKLTVDGVPWQERTSLLEGGANDAIFRVEMDDAGEATVVFGDGVFGKLPDVTSTVIASYRVGGGANGNLGPDSLVRPQPGESPGWFVSVTNPLPAQEGRDWESRDQARRVAPTGFQQPLVAVSAADFEAAADAFLSSNGSPAIQRANASFEWTGSWLTVKLTVDPLGAEGLTSGLRDQLAAYLNSRRLAGHDLEISPPAYVPIDLTIQVTVAVGSQPADVEQALRNVLGSGVLPDGSKGFFHPDNFTFGENLFVSRIFAAVMAVSGVQSANITVLARSHSAQPSQETAVNLSQGYLAVSNDEVIRLDNDRNFPQNGTLTITAAGAQS